MRPLVEILVACIVAVSLVAWLDTSDPQRPTSEADHAGASHKSGKQKARQGDKRRITKNKGKGQKAKRGKGDKGKGKGGEGEQADRDALEALQAIGYLDGVELAPETSGTVVYDRTRAFDGTNLVVSAHGAEVVLLGMDGETLHGWKLKEQVTRKDDKRPQVRRAFLQDDGGLLLIVEGAALFSLDVNSELRWRADDGNHHDLHQMDDGSLWALTREAGKLPWFLGGEEPTLEDFVTHYAADGSVIEEVSVLAAVRDFEDTRFWDSIRKKDDPIHTNSIEVLDGRAAAANPAFAAGNILLSCRSINALLILDPRTGKLVWGMQGEFVGQHDAKVLDDGTMMVFDNQSRRGQSAEVPRGGSSFVRVYDVATEKEIWAYGAGDESFQTHTCGTSERLPNGNTLIVASNAGYAFEIAPDREIVWKWHSSFRPPNKPDLVANLFDVIRSPPARELPWLKR